MWQVPRSCLIQSFIEGLVSSKGFILSTPWCSLCLKKTSLDPSVVNNYRPISKLPFLAKVVEKVVLNKLSTFLNENKIYDQFQSGFRPRHSTGTALLKVTNDLLMSVDAGNCVVLVLLDLSAAFDSADHKILLDHLSQWVGIKWNALKRFSSYLHE